MLKYRCLLLAPLLPRLLPPLVSLGHAWWVDPRVNVGAPAAELSPETMRCRAACGQHQKAPQHPSLAFWSKQKSQ